MLFQRRLCDSHVSVEECVCDHLMMLVTTSQRVSIFKLAPGLLSTGEDQLIGRKGEQVAEFAHQLGFRQPPFAQR
jgi:hypothetical protein